MRAVIVSHTYANPEMRGKLRALVGQGTSLAVAVPARWAAPGVPGEVVSAFGEDGGVRIVPVATRGRDDAGAPVAWRSAALRRLLTDFRPDVIQVEEAPTSQVAAAVTRMARQLGIPVVAFTSDSLPRKHPFMARMRRRRAFSGAAGIIGGTTLAADIVREEFPSPAWAVIPQLGIPVPRAPAPAPHPPLAIGFVGRLVPEKGLDVLFRASIKLYGAWTITVAGSGPALEELEALAERLGIASRITWLGAISRRDLSSVWPTLDCLVVPSRTTAEWVETYPVQVLEAMGNGVAVVTSDSGGLREMTGGAGLIFREDHAEGLAEALARLLADSELCARLGAEGRGRVIAEYADDAIARKTLAFWAEVRARKGN